MIELSLDLFYIMSPQSHLYRGVESLDRPKGREAEIIVVTLSSNDVMKMWNVVTVTNGILAQSTTSSICEDGVDASWTSKLCMCYTVSMWISYRIATQSPVWIWNGILPWKELKLISVGKSDFTIDLWVLLTYECMRWCETALGAKSYRCRGTTWRNHLASRLIW